jgi:hypothetical protein
VPVSAYSQTLWELDAGWDPSIPPESPAVPAGFVWVARSVSVFGGDGSTAGGTSSLLFEVNGFPVWRTPLNATIVGVPYSAGDVRYVLEAGETFGVRSNTGLWAVRVSGYQLSA